MDNKIHFGGWHNSVKHSRLVLCVFILLSFLGFSLPLFASGELLDPLTGPLPYSQLIPEQVFTISFVVHEPLAPVDFIFKSIETSEAENMERLNSEIRVKTFMENENPVIHYTWEISLRPLSVGKAILPPMELVFMNASGEERRFSTRALEWEIVPWFQKYALALGSLLGVLMAGSGFVYLGWRLKSKRRRLALKESALKFKQQKIDAERNALHKLESLQRWIIAGDYEKYASELMMLIHAYGVACYPGSVLDPLAIESWMRKTLPSNALPGLEKLVHNVEAVRFTGKRPNTEELDRMERLTKECLAAHREDGISLKGE